MPSSAAEALPEREIILAGETVRYRLRRSRRRTTGFRIDGDGLLVAAPLRARVGDIESLLRQHQEWVLDKLATWRERPPPPTLALHDGARIGVLDRELTVRLLPAGRPAGNSTATRCTCAPPPRSTPENA